jgi:hypothetical protein
MEVPISSVLQQIAQEVRELTEIRINKKKLCFMINIYLILAIYLGKTDKELRFGLSLD